MNFSALAARIRRDGLLGGFRENDKFGFGHRHSRIFSNIIRVDPKSYLQQRNFLTVLPFLIAQTCDVDQIVTERILLALKILTSHYDPNVENRVRQEEVDELKSYLGDEAAGRSLDEIATMVIQREIKRQEENRP
jgi:hypothetical protein